MPRLSRRRVPAHRRVVSAAAGRVGAGRPVEAVVDNRPMPGLFISYRRDDSQGFAGRLADDLEQILGPHRVFSDVEIPAGSDFTEVLNRAIAGCDALLVVLGRRWAGDATAHAPSRLFDPGDWVRAEIESAFAQRKVVVPVLVGQATMPAPQTLPAPLQRLTRLQAARLDDRHWDIDRDHLLQRLRELLPSLAEAVPAVHDTPASALDELARRALDALRSRRPVPSQPRAGSRLLRWLRRTLRGPLTLALLAGAAYLGVRLFGDAQMQAQLDALLQRLANGWDQLLAMVRRNLR
jgi:hypothetical protein